MSDTKRLRVAALIDLPRSPLSGGHIRGWEWFVKAAAKGDLPVDLTMFSSGPANAEDLSETAHFRQLMPIFSTARLKFLPYIPDHTDLAPYHPELAKELVGFDVIHTTDGFFNYARTAERVSKRHKIPLVTSFHTDTPSYARIFTHKTISTLFGTGLFGRFLTDTLRLPERQEQKMLRRLHKHVTHCCEALGARTEDMAFAEAVLGSDHVHRLRHGIDRDLFAPQRRDRAGIERDYQIPPEQIVILFVGRLDEGKNIYTLIAALETLIAEGLPLHLVTAGIGPAEQALKTRLGSHVSVPGFVTPPDLARLYASVDVLALASEVEMRSMAGGESLASGCPALVSAKSGVVELFHETPAMQRVSGGIDAWTEALRIFAQNPALREKMRETALTYGQNQIASWHTVLAEDFVPVWQRAYATKTA